MSGIETEDCGDPGGGLNLGFFDRNDFVEFNMCVETGGNFTIDCDAKR